MASKKQKVVLDEKEVAGVRRTLEFLEKRYERFIDQPDKDFFLGLADYLKSISDSELLDGLAKILIYQEREKDLGEFWRIEGNFFEEAKKVRPKILKIAKSVEQTNAIKSALNYFERITDHVPSDLINPLELHDGLTCIVRALKESGHFNLVAGYVDLLPDTDQISRYNLCRSHDTYMRLAEQVKRLEKMSVWGSWDALRKLLGAAHQQISFEETHKKNLTRHFFDNIYAGAFDATISGNERSAHFKHVDYKVHVRRVHHFLLEQIQQVINDHFIQEPRKESINKFVLRENVTALEFQKDQQRFMVNGNTPFPLKDAPTMAEAIALFWDFRSDKRCGVEMNKAKERDLSIYELSRNLGGTLESARQTVKRIKAFLKEHHQLPILLRRVGNGKYKFFVSIV